MLYGHSAGGMDYLKEREKIFPISCIKFAITQIKWVDFNLEDFRTGKKKGMNPLPPSELYQNEDKSPFKCRVVLGIKRRKVSFRVHVRLWKCQPPQFLPAPPVSTATRVSRRSQVRHVAREMRLIGAPISVTRHLVCSHSLRLRF